jgi:hypothetical protein
MNVRYENLLYARFCKSSESILNCSVVSVKVKKIVPVNNHNDMNTSFS